MRRIVMFIILISHVVGFSQVLLRESKNAYNFGISHLESNEKGALISLTVPKNQSPTYLINGALLYGNINESNKNDGFNSQEVFIQWNRNTLIDEEQNSFSSGLIFNFSKVKKENKKIFIPITLIGNYYKDFVLDQESVQFSFTLPLIQLEWKKTDLGNVPQIRKNGIFRYNSKSKVGTDKNLSSLKASWVPYLGMEYDYTFKSVDDSLNGSSLRTFVSIIGALVFDKRYEASLAYQYRYSLIDSSSIYNKNMHFIEALVSYIFINSSNFLPTIGLKYVNGQNPIEGFVDQSYLALNFSLKIN